MGEAATFIAYIYTLNDKKTQLKYEAFLMTISHAIVKGKPALIFIESNSSNLDAVFYSISIIKTFVHTHDEDFIIKSVYGPSQR